MRPKLSLPLRLPFVSNQSNFGGILFRIALSSIARVNSFFFYIPEENILSVILLIIECVSLNLIASIIASQETSIRKFMIPTYPYNCSNLVRSTNYTEKQFQFLAPLEDISSSISTKKKRENLSIVAHDFQRRLSYRASQSTGYIFGCRSEKKSEGRGVR